MGLEAGSFISDLVSSNPVGAADFKSQGDDHLRLIKSILQGTFPNANRAFRFETVTAEKTGAYTVLVTDARAVILTNASGGAFTITLPLGSGLYSGFHVTIVKNDNSANAVTVDGNSADTINGAASRTLTQEYHAERYVWSGAEWKVVSVSKLVLQTGDLADGAVTEVKLAPDAVTTVKVADKAITLPKLADVAEATILGRISTGVGPVEDLTPTGVTSMLDEFDTGSKGLVPPPGSVTGKVLHDDGTWDTVSAPTNVAQVAVASNATRTPLGTILADNSIPQSSEGTEIVTVAITPTDAGSTILIEGIVQGSNTNNGTTMTVAVFVDSEVAAIGATYVDFDGGKSAEVLPYMFTHVPGDIMPHIYKLRVGASGGSGFVNGSNIGDVFSTVGPNCTIKVTEILP